MVPELNPWNMWLVVEYMAFCQHQSSLAPERLASRVSRSCVASPSSLMLILKVGPALRIGHCTFVILSRSQWPGQHFLLPFVGLITMLHTPAAIARIAPKIAQLFRRMPTSSSKLPTKAYLLPGVESNTSLGSLFSREQGKNDKHATFDSLIGLSTGEEKTIVRLHMNHLKGPASFVTVKKKEGEVLKGPQSAFVAIGIEVPVLRQPPPVLQASLDMQMGSLSSSFRENIRKFNR